MALKAFGEALAKLGFRAPWRVTGPAAHVEYKEAISMVGSASAVRKSTPASQPMKVIVPHSEVDNIYNVRYHDRKERAAAAVGPSHIPQIPELPFKPVLPDMEKPATLGKPFNFVKTVPLTDYENNGYSL